MDFLALIRDAFTNPILATFAYAGGLLILADAFFGALRAFQNDTFQLAWLYAFAKAKGTLYVRILATFIFGTAIPDVSFGTGDQVVSLPNPLFGYAAIEAATFLGSLYASLRDNITSKDVLSAPEGITVAPTMTPDSTPTTPAPGEEQA